MVKYQVFLEKKSAFESKFLKVAQNFFFFDMTLKIFRNNSKKVSISFRVVRHHWFWQNIKFYDSHEIIFALKKQSKILSIFGKKSAKFLKVAQKLSFFGMALEIMRNNCKHFKKVSISFRVMTNNSFWQNVKLCASHKKNIFCSKKQRKILSVFEKKSAFESKFL